MLYRLESSGTYYALCKRAGKQIRRSLKTTDSALARRRLNELGDKVARLKQTKGASKITFAGLAERWLATHRVHLKEKSICRLDTCLKALTPYFGHVAIRNIGSQQCEAWLTGRGKKISPASYKHERRVLHLRDAHSFEMAKRMTFSALDPAVVNPPNVVRL